MLRSLVGSEMCIRDRVSTQSTGVVCLSPMPEGSMLGQCAADPRQIQLQETVSSYYTECYTQQRWQMLSRFLDRGCRVHLDGEQEVSGEDLVTHLERSTADVIGMSVEAISFGMPSEEDFREAGLSERDRPRVCKVSTGCAVVTMSRSEHSIAQHPTSSWRGARAYDAALALQ
eukprot:TRINITY_DN14002_c0_g1_i4.p1 TRINITY_DN14002_c0_g1~~TRINITY_DN14002_c0_g1_i4.p1  ORF type:complete len:173 (+),score=36.56 TRINITY_DN14002_c0_g1_i4:168-686(+)